MEKETTATSSVFHSWNDASMQSPANSISTSVSCEDAASSSGEEPIQDVQREEPIQRVQLQNQEEIPQSVFDLYVELVEEYEMEGASRHQELPVNEPETYNWGPQAVHTQPLADTTQSMYVVDPRNGQMAADSQLPTLVPARQQSTVVAILQQLHVQPVEEYSGTPGVDPYPVHENPAVNYVDVERPVTSATGQCEAGYATDSLPPVDQRHPEAATGAPIAAVCKKEYYVNQAHMGPAVSEYQIAPLFSASGPNKIGTSPSTKKQRSKRKPRAKKDACPHCGRKFYSQHQVMGHVRACHTDERPYECKYEGCEKKFPRKDDLTRHSKIHMQKMPHQCPFCGRRFSRNELMERHKRTHEPKHVPEHEPDPVLPKT